MTGDDAERLNLEQTEANEPSDDTQADSSSQEPIVVKRTPRLRSAEKSEGRDTSA
jgi:hypothetical protein